VPDVRRLDRVGRRNSIQEAIDGARHVWLGLGRDPPQACRKVEVFFVVHRDTFPWRSSSLRSDRSA
jgi:hypothetical protein